MSNDKYQLCPCGSGKKLKFCCYETRRTLDQLSDEELLRRASEFRVYESRVNSNWQEAGIAEVLIVRQTPSLKYVAGVYLVDVFCLGLKDTFVTITSNYTDIRSVQRSLSQRLKEISYEDGRSIILGAVEYARQHGFEPHEDWTLSGPIVEPDRSFSTKFTFGHNGKPFYVQGPNDPSDIMTKLWPFIENEKANFLSVMQDVALDERCDQIERDLQDGLFEEARDKLEDLIDEYPGCWEPLFLMGTCLALQGVAERAIPFLEQAAVLHPSPDVYYNLAGVHRSLLQIQPAVTSLRKVIELDSAKGEVGKRAKADLEALASSIRESSGLTFDRYFENAERFDQAFRCLMEGHFEQAARGFNLILESQPDHVQSHGNLGLAYAGLGDRVAAIQHLDKAIELDPDYKPAIDNRRVVLAMAPDERLDCGQTRQVDFYADRQRARRTSSPIATPIRLDQSR